MARVPSNFFTNSCIGRDANYAFVAMSLKKGSYRERELQLFKIVYIISDNMLLLISPRLGG